VRTFCPPALGFSRADRDTNVNRIAFVGRLLARHGVLVLVAAISPYAATRDRLRDLSRAAAIRSSRCSSTAARDLIERDVKGLYRRAQAGERSPASPGSRIHTSRGRARRRGAHQPRGSRELRATHPAGALPTAS